MRTIALLCTVAFSAPLAAQEFALKPPVNQLAWMVGEWSGPATSRLGPETHTLRQTERVEIQSGGMTIAVRGRGYEKMPDGSEKVTFEAFAMIFRERDGTLALRAFSMEGKYIDPEIVMKPDGMIWSFDDPRVGRIRYTTTHTAGDEWHEIGETSRDGTTWTRFMEMTLKRQ
jgi:hypothetical protein